MKTISPSQMDAMSCRLAWYLSYVEGYRPKQSSTALELGTAVHEALAHYYLGKGHPTPFFEEWVDGRMAKMENLWEDDLKKMADARTLGIAMLNGYIEEYKSKDNFDVLAIEQNLNREIPVPDAPDERSGCHLAVRLDGLVRDRETGFLWCLEHKTFSRFSLTHLDLDHQFTSQVWVGQALAENMDIEEPVVGVIYNGLRKQTPGPRVKLKLFERHKIYRTASQIGTLLHRAYWQFKETDRDDLPIYPQPNAVRCSGCGFRQVCVEYQRGGDYQFLLDNQFKKRGRK